MLCVKILTQAERSDMEMRQEQIAGKGISAPRNKAWRARGAAAAPAAQPRVLALKGLGLVPKKRIKNLHHCPCR